MIHFEVLSFDFKFHFEVLSFGFKFHFEGWLSCCFRIQLGKLPQYRRTVADKKRKFQVDFASVTACFLRFALQRFQIGFALSVCLCVTQIS